LFVFCLLWYRSQGSTSIHHMFIRLISEQRPTDTCTRTSTSTETHTHNEVQQLCLKIALKHRKHLIPYYHQNNLNYSKQNRSERFSSIKVLWSVNGLQNYPSTHGVLAWVHYIKLIDWMTDWLTGSFDWQVHLIDMQT